jgi:2-haloalkanoic acid dehalogenase type II
MKIKAIAFDAFPIFSPSPVFALAEKLFPGNGPALSDEWRNRQFEYAWLRMAAHHYADFWQITQDALTFAANKLKLDLTADKREALMNAYLQLTVWPDVPAALNRIKTLGLRLAFLSNFTQRMLDLLHCLGARVRLCLGNDSRRSTICPIAGGGPIYLYRSGHNIGHRSAHPGFLAYQK